MELKVWVEGIQRVVCGVSEQTTCQDVVIALAHASGKTGRFTLIEKWRENERLLTPVEQPLKVLHKWGEYATDVQFILRHSGVCAKTERAGRRTEKPLLPHNRFESRQGSGSVKRNLTFSGPRGGFNAPKHHGKKPPGVGQNSSLESLDGRSSFSSRSTMSPYASFDKRQQRAQPYPQLGHPVGVNTAIVHSPQSSYGSTCSPKSDSTPFSSLERQKKGRPSPVPVVPPHNNNNNCKPSVQALTKTLPPPVKGPRIHIEEYNLDLNLSPANNKHTKERQLSPKNFKQDSGIGGSPPNEHVITAGKSNGVSGLKVGEDSRQVEFRDKATNADDASKEELIKLVNLQMEKLESQESLMAKLNSEVTMLEKKETAYQTKYKSIQEEMKRLEATEYDYDNELEELELVSWEDKLELERHRRDNLRSEITLIRSRVDSKELEMVTVKRKEEKLVEDIEEVEKKQKLCAQETEETEMKVLQEISELQKQINQKLVDHEENQGSVDELLSDVKKLESEILERKTSIAGLEKDLLHANLEQFRVMPTDCLRTRESRPFDRNSPSRPGSARKMTQSPQRLIEAVPTIKDPHGLWV